MIFFLHFIYRYETSQYKKASDKLKRKNDIKKQLDQLPNIHILRRNPTSRWVDFKATHQLGGYTQNLHMQHVY